MKKKQKISLEDLCFTAERQYKRMMANVRQGIIDKEEIGSALAQLNRVHAAAIEQDKRHLLMGLSNDLFQ